MTRTLKDFRPQHDDDCESNPFPLRHLCGCSWKHSRQLQRAEGCTDTAAQHIGKPYIGPKPCTCGLDALLRERSPQPSDGAAMVEAWRVAEKQSVVDELRQMYRELATAINPQWPHGDGPQTHQSLLAALHQPHPETVDQAKEEALRQISRAGGVIDWHAKNFNFERARQIVDTLIAAVRQSDRSPTGETS